MSYSCGNCGAEFEKGTKFCPNCGTKINWKKTNDNQDESSDRYKLYGLLFVAICACISMGIFIYLGDWFLAIFLTICLIFIVGGFITYAEENDIPKNITLLLTCCIGIVYLAIAINNLDNYWDLQKEMKQRVQETERMEKEQKKEEADRKAREKKEAAEREANKEQDKINQVIKGARKDVEWCFESQYSFARNVCKNHYIQRFGTPTTDEDFRMFKLYEEEYMKKWSEKQKAKEKMDEM